MPGCKNPPTGFLQLLTWIDLSQGASLREQPSSLAALHRALCREAVASSPIRATICPYRGLEPFREEDTLFFCGRDEAIRQLVAKVQEHSFVAVVGRSGSGKSSLVFAGLLPALRKQHQMTIWDVVSLRPGASPLRALAEAFGTLPEDAGPAERDSYLEKEASLYREEDPAKLKRIVSDRLKNAREHPDRLLIYVDQWEELYAMAPAEKGPERDKHFDDVEKFIALLVKAASGPRPQASVVITVRADFYDSLMRNALLNRLLPPQQMNIPSMQPSDLRSAIETPAANVELAFDPPELVDRIIDDVGTDEGRLPLLQFALKEIWERREGDRLTAQAYMEVGGVMGAIQSTAEREYERLKPAQKEAARRLFMSLVTPGEGQEDTRARSTIPDDPQQREIIQIFSNRKTRLLVTGYDMRATVEVAHEALIRRWPMLHELINENREKLRIRAAILREKEDWEKHEKNEQFLLPPGIRLERGRDLLANPGDIPVDHIREYVNLSIKKEERRLAAEREAALAEERRVADYERKAKEAAERRAQVEHEAHDAAETARRKLRNRFIVTVAAGGIAVLASSWLLWFSYGQWVAARPWARLVSVSTGRSYLLTQKTANIGRLVPGGIQHQLALRCQAISRIHLSIANTGLVHDWRSLYGTTVNSEPLRYGDSRQLHDGNVLILAGQAAFVYRRINWRPWHYLRNFLPHFLPEVLRGPELSDGKPTKGWAVLVDRAGRILPIQDAETFIVIRANGIELSDHRDGAVLAIRMRDKDIPMIELDDGVSAIHYRGFRSWLTLKKPTSVKTSIMTIQRLSAKEDFESWIKRGDYFYHRIILPPEGEVSEFAYTKPSAGFQPVGSHVDSYVKWASREYVERMEEKPSGSDETLEEAPGSEGELEEMQGVHRVGGIVFKTRFGQFQVVPTTTDDGGAFCEPAESAKGGQDFW